MEIQRDEVAHPPRRVEILHFENYDALVNNQADGDPQRIQQLLQEVYDGIPGTWQPLKGQQRIPPNIFLDNPLQARFVAKKREVLEHYEAKKAFKTSQDEWHYKFPKRRIYAYFSLVNEIRLAPRIKRILDLYEAKQIAVDHGYIDIRYVEPLLGIINRSSGEKTMFYDFVDGVSATNIVGSKSWREGIQEKDRIESLSANLDRLFILHNINPEDLQSRQFIYPHNNQRGKPVYLIDTEGYFEIKK